MSNSKFIYFIYTYILKNERNELLIINTDSSRKKEKKNPYEYFKVTKKRNIIFK